MQSAGRAALQQLELLSWQQQGALQALLQQRDYVVAAACRGSRCISSYLLPPGFALQTQQRQKGSGGLLQGSSSSSSSRQLFGSCSVSSSSSSQTTTSSTSSGSSSSGQNNESLQQIRARIFEQHIGDGRRSGRQVLLRPLKGRHIAEWYFTLTGPKMAMLEDDIEEERQFKVQLARATGSGPPKKGQGKRAGRKK
eukprot:GHRQ01002337.1.p1 GENE.GHRQ01002337.1~~GHRQ01002337.1.p1  ORF type:complete len:196 (+),score=102.90 GHRQ01002337.1:152-739(+)